MSCVALQVQCCILCHPFVPQLFGSPGKRNLDGLQHNTFVKVRHFVTSFRFWSPFLVSSVRVMS